MWGDLHVDGFGGNVELNVISLAMKMENLLVPRGTPFDEAGGSYGEALIDADELLMTSTRLQQSQCCRVSSGGRR